MLKFELSFVAKQSAIITRMVHRLLSILWNS